MIYVEIPFNKPHVTGHEEAYMRQAIANCHISGAGPFTARCQALLESELGVRRALLSTSCTDALEMAALLLRIEPGDEVIIPDFTFVSTVNAFVLRGASPRFVDIRPDTLNLDEKLVEAAINSRTRAIVPVHYAGVGCEMEALGAIAARHGLYLVEDNAHGLFGSYRGRPLGSFGALAALSFHETKNFSCGEGGALLLNDERLIERAEILREKGTDRTRFFRGQVDKYQWVDVGSSYLPSDLLAAFLLAQLEARGTIQATRRRIFELYAAELCDWAAEFGVGMPVVPPHCEHPYHLFYLILPSLDARTRLIAHLSARGIGAVFHYLPLHLSAMGQKFGGRAGQFPITESVSERLLRLPFHNGLAEDEQRRVMDAVREFYPT